MSPTDQYPQVFLFDMGGVCVVSPFQAILDYEKRQGIPLGWVNFAISTSGPQGWWSRLERGEVPLDAAFFRGFHADLTDEPRWRQYCARAVAKARDQKSGGSSSSTTRPSPPVPSIDAEWLYWEMMRMSREVDPHMFPALQRLRRPADAKAGKRRIVLGALSNTSIFPAGHPFLDDDATPEGRRTKELRGIFDVFVSSAHVGMRKPAEDIYRYAVTRLHEHVKLTGAGAGVRPQDITFLDDIGGNLKTARKLGMNTIKVQLGKTDEAVLELEKLSGLDLRGDKARL